MYILVSESYINNSASRSVYKVSNFVAIVNKILRSIWWELAAVYFTCCPAST